MNTIKEARQAAGLTQKQMATDFEIPSRTLEAWEMGERKPPKYVEKLIVEKLEFLAAEAAKRTKRRNDIKEKSSDITCICHDCESSFDEPEILSEPKGTRKGYESDECCPICGSVNIDYNY